MTTHACKTNYTGRMVASFLALGLASCGESTGSLTVLLDAEDTISEGLEPGAGDENIVDGWAVSFDRYIVAIGDVRLARGDDLDGEVTEPTVLVVDLAAIPASGVTLARFEDVAAVRWDRFEYATPPAPGATRHETVEPADFDEMVANGWTYLIEGVLTNASGESCPPGGACRPATEIAFRLGVPLEARFGPCEAEEGLPGVTVVEGGTTVSATIHGDHLFFDGFPSGAEVIERRAQWLANADTDGDDAVSPAELMGLDAFSLFPADTHNVSGAPYPVVTAWDYVRGQLATQGHFQGEGECPWTVR